MIQSCQIFLIFLTLVSKANVLHFLHLENFAMINLTNKGGFCNDKKITIFFHFHYSIYRLDLYFLLERNNTFLKLFDLASLGILLHPEYGKFLNEFYLTVINCSRISWILVWFYCSRWLAIYWSLWNSHNQPF